MKVDLSEIKGPGAFPDGINPKIKGESGITSPVVPNNTGQVLGIDIEEIRGNLAKMNEKQKKSILSSNIMRMVLL